MSNEKIKKLSLELTNIRSRTMRVNSLVLSFFIYFTPPATAAFLDKEKSDKPLIDSQSFEPLNLDGTLSLEQLKSGQTDQEADRLAREGAILLDSGKPKEALARLKKAWELNNKLAPVGVMIATTHLKAKEYNEALSAAQKLLKENPELPDGSLLEGLIYATMGESDKAIAAFKQTLAITPGNFSALYNLANLAMIKKDYQTAREYLKIASVSQPDNLKLLLGSAKLEILENNLTAAETLFKKAITAHPKEQEPVIELGRLYLAQQEFDKAISITEPALTNFPSNETIVDILSKAYLNLEQPLKAQKLLQNFIANFPTDINANLNLALIFEKTKQYKEALQQIEKTQKIDNQHVASQFLHARLLVKTGNLTRANGELDKLSQTLPNDTNILGLQAEIALNEKRPQDAIALLQKAIQNNGTNLLNVQLAIAYVRNAQIKEAYGVLENWLKEHPSDIFTLKALADLSIQNNMPDKALQIFQHIIEIEPNDAMAHNNSAFLLLKTGNTAKALAHAERAYQLKPDNASILDTYASIQQAQGNIDKAINLFKEASKADPNSVVIHLNLARALIKNGEKTEAKNLLKKANGLVTKDTEKQEITKLLETLRN